MADLENVIATAVSDAYPNEQVDTSSSDGGEEVAAEPVVDEAPVAEAVVEAPADEGELKPAAPDAETEAPAAGEKAKNPNQRIPLHRHEAILQKARAEAAQQVEQLNQRLAVYEEPETQASLQAFKLAGEDPQRFLQVLAQHPQYQQLLAPLFQQPQPQAQPDFNIEPDVRLGDGLMGYSPEAMQRMLDARAAAVEQRITQQFEQKFGPVAQAYEQSQLVKTYKQKVTQQLQQAAAWPGFTENREAIAEAVQKDNLTLEQAYHKVVLPKLSQSRDDMRRQILAELKQKPHAVSGLAPAAARPAMPSSAPRDLEDVIRESLASQGLS